MLLKNLGATRMAMSMKDTVGTGAEPSLPVGIALKGSYLPGPWPRGDLREKID